MSVCKYKRAGHCIACSMTKPQKKIFKKLKKPELQEAFIEMLRAQQAQMGRFEGWERLYAKKAGKKGVALKRVA